MMSTPKPLHDTSADRSTKGGTHEGDDDEGRGDGRGALM